VGIMLLYITLIFAACSLLKKWWYKTLAAAVVGLLLIGPGFAAMWIHQDYAHESHAEIDRIVPAVIEIRKLIYLPVHLVIYTDPDWVLAKYTDASDVILHEAQDKLFKRNEPATIDFLKTGVYPENYAMLPGSCTPVNGQASAGMCLDALGVRNSRWGALKSDGTPYHPYEDVVIVHWDERAGTLTLVRSLQLADLAGYNITTAGPTELKSSLDRVAVPMP
jgi:hypothetical protein